MAKALTIYKASAGSGKTFTLSLEFIKLLITDTHRYEHILAVTFTNKATEEMKHRIVTTLYGLSHHLKDTDDYMIKIKEALGLSEDVIATRAEEALHNLLHNYNQFRVQTIDSFFQSVLRNMAKELGLGSNMRISLNDPQIISQAVDSLMESLDNDPKLLSWIMKFIDERMDDSKSWNITGEVKSFGMNLSKEFFKTHETELEPIGNDQKFFEAYEKKLRSRKKTILETYKSIAEGFFNILSQNGFTAEDLLQGKKGVAGYFIKLQDGRINDKSLIGSYVAKAMDSPDAWAKKGNTAVISLAANTLLDYLLKTEKQRVKDVRILNSIDLTLANINKMRLLFAIRSEVDELNKQNARFMLSNTQVLLSEMISGNGSDAPFIFEKIGTYLQHIMIDEFQDTSKVQWQNFHSLLKECMSVVDTELTPEQKTINNLIVGDVKQSIYRFRSGDWRLLNNIDSNFNEGQTDHESLNTNWRSERNIIWFNNAFFKHAAAIEADRILNIDKDMAVSEEIRKQREEYAKSLLRAYADVAQNVSPQKLKRALGYVNIEFIASEEFREEAMQRTLNYVLSLTHQDVALSDIAIIVRNNSEATDIAQYFAINAPSLSIVSEQAFTLSASPLVLMIICTMKYLTNPSSLEAKFTLLKLYMDLVIKTDITDAELLSDSNSFATYIPEPISNPDMHSELLAKSLNELTEYIYNILSLSEIKGQEAYASAFFDGLKKFLEDNGAILEDFLEYWDTELANKAISIGSLASIRVITIHKSKGLEFKHVIMPFANWSISSTPLRSETLWCDIKDEGFNELPFIPVTYTGKKSLDNSIYEQFGTEEWMQQIVDNLNLLYVAFTRAERSLYIITDQNIKEDRRTNLIVQTLLSLEKDVEKTLEGAIYDGIDDIIENAEKKSSSSKKKDAQSIPEPSDASFTFGKQFLADKEPSAKQEQTAENEVQNIFDTDSEDIHVRIKSYDNKKVLFKQSNKSREFADDSLSDEDSHRYTTMGSVLHMLFSQIHTLEDVDGVLRQFEFDGIIYNKELTAEDIRQTLHEKFEIPEIQDWFSPRWTVFNECNIMRLEKGKIVEERPDRVITDGNETIVIDYKFGKPNRSYVKQVQSYMKLMTDMGYANVKGYLWYVTLNEIVPVER